MLTRLRRERSEGCISDFAFDAWRAGELDQELIEGYEAHLEHCERCQRRHDAIESEAELFLEKFPLLDLPRENESKRVVNLRGKHARWLGWTSGALGVMVVAAAFLLLVRSRVPKEDGPLATDATVGVRTKGSSHIGFFVKHGENVRRGSDGQVVHPGDRLRFTLTSRNPRHVAILSLDGAGVASVYYPRGTTSELVAAIRDQPVDSSVELDDTLGEEHIWGIFCDAPFELGPLKNDLEQRGRLPSMANCAVDELSIVKEAAP